jgi:hypothetical protein
MLKADSMANAAVENRANFILYVGKVLKINGKLLACKFTTLPTMLKAFLYLLGIFCQPHHCASFWVDGCS